MEEGLYTAEHMEMRAALSKLIEKEINPYVDEWEKAQMFPAKKVGVARYDGCSLMGVARHDEWLVVDSLVPSHCFK